jgi:small conductance mechanosensitive channel
MSEKAVSDFAINWIAQLQHWVVDVVPSLAGAIILLIAGWIVAGTAETWFYRSLGAGNRLDETVRRFLSKALRYAILVIVLVAVLAQFGVQTASIIAALGAAGLAIGLALQGTLQNVAAGIMLIVLRPFKVGEFVAAGSLMGTVVEIGLFMTELKTVDGLFLAVPNSQLWSSAITNYSRHEIRRNDLAVGIGYGDDIAKAESVMRDIADRDERVLGDPEPATFVAELGDSSVVVTLRYWTATSDWWATSRDLTKEVKLALDESGISIPFPQRDVHHVSGLQLISSQNQTTG